MEKLNAKQAKQALENGVTACVWLVFPLVNSNNGLYSVLSVPESVLNHVDHLVAKGFVTEPQVKGHFFLTDSDSYKWEKQAALETTMNAPVQLVSEEQYNDQLGAVPPFQMMNVEGLNCFIVGEFTAGRTAQMFAEDKSASGSLFYKKLVHVDEKSTWITRAQISAIHKS